MSFASPATVAFSACVSQRPVDLARAAGLIAVHATPGLEPDEIDRKLDAIASEIPRGSGLRGILSALFGEHGFRGAASDYYNPDNSHIGRVIERRRGNPITLSVITIAVAQRCGVELSPVGMPGHFLVGHNPDGDERTWIDCFDQGRTLDEPGCRRLFESIAGAGVRFDPAWLGPTQSDEVVARMLNNLVAVHDRTGDVKALRWSALLRALVGVGDTSALAGYADRVGAAGHAGHAAQIHDALAEIDPSHDQDAALRWWARLN